MLSFFLAKGSPNIKAQLLYFFLYCVDQMYNSNKMGSALSHKNTEIQLSSMQMYHSLGLIKVYLISYAKIQEARCIITPQFQSLSHLTFTIGPSAGSGSSATTFSMLSRNCIMLSDLLQNWYHCEAKASAIFLLSARRFCQGNENT